MTESTDARINNLVENYSLGEEKPNYPISKYRWISLSCLSLILLSTSASITFLPSVEIIFKETYTGSLFLVELSFMLKGVIYIPSFFLLAAPLIQRTGCRMAIYIGSLLMGCYLLLRLLINQSYAFWLGGAILAGIAIPFLSTLPPKLSANWFPPRQRTLATSIITFCFPLGGYCGIELPFIFIKEYISKDKYSKYERKIQFFNGVLLECVLFISIMVIACIFYREKPKVPPSYTTGKKISKLGVIKSIRELLMNKNFLLLAVVYGMSGCAINTYFANIGGVLEALSIPYETAFYMGISSLPAGIVGNLGMSYYVGRTQEYKRSALIIYLLNAITFCIMIICLYWSSIGVVIGASMLNGLFFTSCLPIMYEFGVELTYPINQSIIAAFAVSLLQLLQLAANGICSLLLNQITSKMAIYFGLIMSALALSTSILIIFVKERKKRSELDFLHIRENIETEDSLLINA